MIRKSMRKWRAILSHCVCTIIDGVCANKETSLCVSSQCIKNYQKQPPTVVHANHRTIPLRASKLCKHTKWYCLETA
jgi:hypothetical protein